MAAILILAIAVLGIWLYNLQGQVDILRKDHNEFYSEYVDDFKRIDECICELERADFLSKFEVLTCVDNFIRLRYNHQNYHTEKYDGIDVCDNCALKDACKNVNICNGVGLGLEPRIIFVKDA